MTEKDDLRKRRQADRRTALLALAADRNHPSLGNCLSEQEMGLLLDGKCPEKKRGDFLSHLAFCDSCYREWLELDGLLSEQHAVARKKFLFLRPKMLTVGGSLLAAAASVLFFVNLQYSPGPGDVVLPELPGVELQADVEKKKEVKRKVMVEAVESTEESWSRPVLPAVPSKSVRSITDSTQERAAGQSFSVTSERAAPQLASTTEIEEISLEQWLVQIERNCRRQGVSQAQWRKLAGQGTDLLAIEETLELSTLVRSVYILAETENSSEECEKIVALLSEKKKISE